MRRLKHGGPRKPIGGRPSFETGASPDARTPGLPMSRWQWPDSRCQTAWSSSFPRRVVAPGFCPRDRVHPRNEGWAERRQAHYFICRVSETRRVRTRRGAARPMTRDARLTALHRGDFRPGAALPSPALPPDPCSDAPRSQVIVPGGRCPGPPEPAVTSRGRRTPLPAPPFRTVSRKTPLHERGWESMYYKFVT